MLRMSCVALALLLTIGRVEAEPSLFWFNDPVGPDDSVVVTGAGLDAIRGITIGRVPDQGSSPDTVASRSVEMIQQNAQSVKFSIPKDFAPGIYRFTLTYPQGSVSARLNLPTVYWTQANLGDPVSPGGTVQIFGRNIVRRPDRAKLVLVPEVGGQPVALSPDSGNLWRGMFKVPEAMSPGDYRLQLSNGDGADDEFVDVERLHVAASASASHRTFNVREYGAIGDGSVNSAWAVKAAVAAAEKSGGGTVYFPRGRYLMSGSLELPAGVSLKGEREDLVNLVWSDTGQPVEALIAGSSHFSIEDLTIYASMHGPVVVGGFLKEKPIPDASDIAIRRVRIRASAFRGHLSVDQTYQRMQTINQHFGQLVLDSVRLSGNRVAVTDCDVVGSGRALYLLKASNVVISGNILNNGRFGWYSLTGVNRVIFENNIVAGADLQGTGGSINTLSADVTAAENVIFTGNTFKAMYGWDREAVTTDGSGGFYFGPAVSTASDRLSLPGPANEHVVAVSWVGAIVMVVDGLGAGQFARVARFDGAANGAPMSVALDRQLAVDLDATSVVTIVQMRQNYLIVDNVFEDAGVAVQSYGTGLNHVIAGNVSMRTGGFFALGSVYYHFQPCWQVQLLDNRIVEGNAYQAGPDRTIASGEALISVQARRWPGTTNGPPLVRAVVVRGNQMEEDSHIELAGGSPVFPGVRDVIVEGNIMGATRVGLRVDRGVQWWLERRNASNVIPR